METTTAASSSRYQSHKPVTIEQHRLYKISPLRCYNVFTYKFELAEITPLTTFHLERALVEIEDTTRRASKSTTRLAYMVSPEVNPTRTHQEAIRALAQGAIKVVFFAKLCCQVCDIEDNFVLAEIVRLHSPSTSDQHGKSATKWKRCKDDYDLFWRGEAGLVTQGVSNLKKSITHSGMDAVWTPVFQRLPDHSATPENLKRLWQDIFTVKFVRLLLSSLNDSVHLDYIMATTDTKQKKWLFALFCFLLNLKVNWLGEVRGIAPSSCLGLPLRSQSGEVDDKHAREEYAASIKNKASSLWTKILKDRTKKLTVTWEKEHGHTILERALLSARGRPLKRPLPRRPLKPQHMLCPTEVFIREYGFGNRRRIGSVYIPVPQEPHSLQPKEPTLSIGRDLVDVKEKGGAEYEDGLSKLQPPIVSDPSGLLTPAASFTEKVARTGEEGSGDDKDKDDCTLGEHGSSNKEIYGPQEYHEIVEVSSDQRASDALEEALCGVELEL